MSWYLIVFRLHTIELQDNKLTTIPRDFLPDITNIQQLRLDENLLTSVEAFSTIHFMNTAVLHFEENNFYCGTTMCWLLEMSNMYVNGVLIFSHCTGKITFWFKYLFLHENMQNIHLLECKILLLEQCCVDLFGGTWCFSVLLNILKKYIAYL